MRGCFGLVFFILVPSYLPVSQPGDKTEFMSHQGGTRKGRRETETDREDYAEGFFFFLSFKVSPW